MFCVYLIKYNGNKLPPFYIGSTSVKKLEAGYRGSVKSIKWGEIFTKEYVENFSLFTYEILKIFDTRSDALKYEKEIQEKNNVVKSKWFFNESIAAPNGMCGRDVSGNLNPMFGVCRKGQYKPLDETIEKQRHSINEYYKTESGKNKRRKMSEIFSGENNPMFGKTQSEEFKKKMSDAAAGKNNPMFGKTHSESARKKMSDSKKGKPSPTKGMYMDINHYLVNGEIIKNARKFCEENNHNHCNFLKAARFGKPYKGMIITKIVN